MVTGRYIGTVAAAAILGVSREHALRLITINNIRKTRVGRAWAVKRGDVEKLRESRERDRALALVARCKCNRIVFASVNVDNLLKHQLSDVIELIESGFAFSIATIKEVQRSLGCQCSKGV